MSVDSERVQAIVQAVAAAPDGASAALLDRECGADDDLRRAVEATLLQNQAVQTPAPDVNAPTLYVDDGKDPNLAPTLLPGFEDETPSKPKARFADGGKLGKYDIIRFLARGGMGEVYRGFDPLVERDVALKVLSPGLSKNSIAMQRFLAEARAVGKLLHSHTVALYEIGLHEQTYFLAMEFVPGGSLADLIAKQGKVDWKRATRYLYEVCDGLAAAHAVGVIHRDIKPENLLLTLDDHVKITDFGLAKALDSAGQPALNLTSPGNTLGTPIYMSPEQFAGVGVDHRSDLYSAGATYYYLLTGQRPYFKATTVIQLMHSHATAPVPDPREIVSNLPAGCAAVIARAMAKEQGQRYSSATEMAAALTQLLQTTAAKPEMVFWIVEPSRLQARSLQMTLSELGVAKIRVLGTAAEALDAAKQELPTAILASSHLNDGAGADLLARIHALPGGECVFSFLLSSDAATSSPTLMRPGKPQILAKPVNKEVLKKVVAGAGIQGV